MDFYEIYARIRLWIQPYWVPKYELEDKPRKKKKKKKGKQPQAPQKKKKKVKKKKKKEQHWTAYLEGTEKYDTFCKVVTYPEEIIPFQTEIQPGYDTIWCYHDDKMHQVLGHFKANAGYRYKDRNDKKRKQLKPLIFPRQNKPFDRTHLIPIGYHNSENDQRLLIGWDSKQNRGPFNTFEQRQKQRMIPIYWFTQVERTPVGARWTFRIFSEQGAILDELETEMIAPFIWQS